MSFEHLNIKAIAAMSRNRVIGNQGQIPWRLPEDFKFVKKMTSGHILLMGRHTFESIGKPLPNRRNVVLSRSMKPLPGVEVISGWSALDTWEPFSNTGQIVWIFGGETVYRQALPWCNALYLTVVNREVEGDAFFPAFEDDFVLDEVIQKSPEFDIHHYLRVS